MSAPHIPSSSSSPHPPRISISGTNSSNWPAMLLPSAASSSPPATSCSPSTSPPAASASPAARSSAITCQYIHMDEGTSYPRTARSGDGTPKCSRAPPRTTRPCSSPPTPLPCVGHVACSDLPPGMGLTRWMLSCSRAPPRMTRPCSSPPVPLSCPPPPRPCPPRRHQLPFPAHRSLRCMPGTRGRSRRCSLGRQPRCGWDGRRHRLGRVDEVAVKGNQESCPVSRLPLRCPRGRRRLVRTVPGGRGGAPHGGANTDLLARYVLRLAGPVRCRGELWKGRIGHARARRGRATAVAGRGGRAPWEVRFSVAGVGPRPVQGCIEREASQAKTVELAPREQTAELWRGISAAAKRAILSSALRAFFSFVFPGIPSE
ncbi:hypothetical protein ACQ4PT_032139 [Festuca glaucescens]